MPRATSSSISSSAPGQLGRERHLAHRAGVEQAAQQREVGVAAALGVVDAEALGRDERALEVRAEHARADAVGRHRAQGGEDRPSRAR